VSSKNRAFGFYSPDATSAVGDSVFYDNTLGVTGGKTIGCNNFDGTVLCAPPGSS
jgi:hypothetical protein